MKLAELGSRLSAWLDGSGPRADIVLSSRVRLARNLPDQPFPHRANDVQRGRVYRRVVGACAEAASLAGSDAWNLDELGTAERPLFVERHLASPSLVDGTGDRGVVVAPGEGLAVMVNEEDHVRIQSVTSGFNLQTVLESASRLDRELEPLVPFASSRAHGYLTACPTNVGTGMRASVLIHLAGLALAGESKRVQRAVSEMGMAVRGWFGEGTSALGDFYQLSNQRTLGRDEEQAVEELARVAERVLEYERQARE
jgi:protein arginine kinase